MTRSLQYTMTPLQVLDASLTHFHRDFPRKAFRSFGWVEDESVEYRKMGAAKKRRLNIYNGGGMLVAFGGLDFLMEVIRTDGYCYSLLM